MTSSLTHITRRTVKNSTRLTAGFTLIELLIAMAIFSMVSLTSFTIFNTVLSSDETLKLRNERLNELNTAFLLIERDFLQLARRSIRVNGEAPVKGYLHLDSDGVFSETVGLAFVKGGWTNPGLLLPRSDMQPVIYQLKDNQLQRLHFNFVDSVLGTEPYVRALVNNVDDVTFEFFIKNKWQAELSNEQLPQAVALTIFTQDFGEIRKQYLLPAPAQGNEDDSGTSR